MSYSALAPYMHVTIVGAGPTGLSAALYLSSEGIDVTVIDRMSERTYDRYHEICGAGISEKAFRQLKYIEPEHVRNPIEYGELRFPGDITVRMSVKGYVLDRVRFLHSLKEKCESKGCRFMHGTVTDVVREGDGFRILVRGMDDILCDRIIGCDGAHSIVRKRLFGWRPKEFIPTTECIVEGTPEPTFRMDLGEQYLGVYAWTFPAGDDVSIGAKCIISGKVGRYQRWWDRSILSSYRFMDFHHKIMEWKDEDFMDAAEPFRNCRNIYLWGIKAILTKPKYVREYFGCLQTFRHSW